MQGWVGWGSSRQEAGRVRLGATPGTLGLSGVQVSDLSFLL